MQEFQEEVKKISSLFPQIKTDEIIDYMKDLPDEVYHLRIQLTLTHLYGMEEKQNLLKLHKENMQFAELIHGFFPIFSIEKILKKLNKHGSLRDRCHLVLRSILKFYEEELQTALNTIGGSSCNAGDISGEFNKSEESDNDAPKHRLNQDCENQKEGCEINPKIIIHNGTIDDSVESEKAGPSCLRDIVEEIGNSNSDDVHLCDINGFQYSNTGRVDGSGDTVEYTEDVDILNARLCLEPEISNGRLDPDSTEEIYQEPVLSPYIISQVEQKSDTDTFQEHFETTQTENYLINNAKRKLDPETNHIPHSFDKRSKESEQNGDISQIYLQEPYEASITELEPEYLEEIRPLEVISNRAQRTLQATSLSSVEKRRQKSANPEPIKKKQRIDLVEMENGNNVAGPSRRNDEDAGIFDLVTYLCECTSIPREEISKYLLDNEIPRYRRLPEHKMNILVNFFLRKNQKLNQYKGDKYVDERIDNGRVSSQPFGIGLDRYNSESEDAEEDFMLFKELAPEPITLEDEEINEIYDVSQTSSQDSNGEVKSYEKKTKYSSQVIYRLVEIFPDADPDYLRRLCDQTPMQKDEPAFIDAVIEKMLQTDNYPKRPQKETSPVREVDVEEQIAFVSELLPDADPSYLRRKITELSAEELKDFVADALENRNYPTMKEYLRKQQLSAQMRQYTTEFSVENFVRLLPDPISALEDPNRKASTAKDDVYYMNQFLRNKFDKVSARVIQLSLIKNNYHLYKTYNELKKSAPSMKRRRAKVFFEIVLCKSIPLIQEIAFIEHEAEILSYIQQLKEQQEQERVQAKETGLMITCSCCYDDEVMPIDSYMCENKCVFCKQCVITSTEVALGEGRLDYPCLGDCNSHFSLQTLQSALPPNLFSKIAQKKAVAEVKAAGIEDLEFCPFCDFATIPHGPPETDKIFACQNSDCLKESCRLCKEPSHVPLRCDEVEKDEDVKKRVFIENKMTEALLRKCWKCGISFYKEEGCNKMTCSCGAHMCYICGKPVTNYQHFNGIGGDRHDLCPLYSDTLKVNQQNVLKGAEAAKEEVGVASTSDLKFDPTADVERHFADRKNMVPREPHIEQLERVQQLPRRNLQPAFAHIQNRVQEIVANIERAGMFGLFGQAPARAVAEAPERDPRFGVQRGGHGPVDDFAQQIVQAGIQHAGVRVVRRVQENNHNHHNHHHRRRMGHCQHHQGNQNCGCRHQH